MTVTPCPRENSNRPSSLSVCKRPEHRVRVDPEHRRQVPSRREPLTGFRLTVGNGAADGGSDLFVQGDRAVEVDFHLRSGTSHNVTIRFASLASRWGIEKVSG